MQIAQSGRATLSLIAYEEVGEESEANSANFADREQIEIVLSGSACADIRQRGGSAAAPVSSGRLNLEPGQVLNTSGPMLARQISKVRGCLALLQLTREPIRPRPSCEIRLSDGAIIHKSCGEKRVSQQEMALAVLGAMKRKDALPAITDIARRDGPDHLRWEALRQALHLNPDRGFSVLSAISSDAKDELSIPAGALRQQLLETHPQLEKGAALRPQMPCPN